MKAVPEIIECLTVGPTSVRLAFRDGWTGTLDLAPALRGRIFGTLKRPEKFRQVEVCDGTLVWPNGADICPTVLRYWCELGRVCSQEELDKHFASVLSAGTVSAVAETRARYRAKPKK
jgi:hypothetical protein